MAREAARAAQRGLLALAAGAALFAGHPPVDLSAAGWVALTPLVLLAGAVAADPRPGRTGFAWGTVAGLAFFLPLITWIARFGLAPWLLLSLVQACFVGLFVALLAVWGERPGRAVVAVAAWVGLEVVRSAWPLGGFPWGVLGYTQHGGGPLLGLARGLGVLGVSAALAVTGVALAELLRSFRPAGRPGRTLLRAGAAVLTLLAAAGVLGGGLLDPLEQGPGTVDLAAVQGNDVELPPITSRTDTGRVVRIVDRMVVATAPLAADLPDVVVWPENALDADPRSSAAVGERVAAVIDDLGGTPLLAGALLDGPRPRTFYNAIVQLGHGAEVEDAYLKRHLVPFGEYVPWRPVLGDLPPLQAIPSDGLEGDRPHVLRVGGAVVGPVTCFESIFPVLVHDQVRAGAEVLVVSTNNASFGRTPASRQHLAFSQLRAVETGRWVLHAGISGISGVVDPSGRVTQQTELFEQAIVRADLPLVGGRTLATRVGGLVGWLALLVTGAALAWRMTAGRRPPSDAVDDDVVGAA